MKKIFLIVFLSSFRSFAQKELPSAFSEGENLRHYISSKFMNAMQTNELRNIGLDGVSFLSFTISKSKIQNINVALSTPKQLDSFLRRAIEIYQKSDLYSTSVIDTSMYSFIIPIEYMLQKNGMTTSVSTNSSELATFNETNKNLNKKNVTILPKLEFITPFDEFRCWRKMRVHNSSNL